MLNPLRDKEKHHTLGVSLNEGQFGMSGFPLNFLRHPPQNSLPEFMDLKLFGKAIFILER